MKKFEGNLDGRGLRVGIVNARFNEVVTEKLLEGALRGLKKCNVEEEDINVVIVPGSFDIPGILKKLAQSNNFDVLIALGAVVRGETPHFDYVAAEVSKGVANVALNSLIPVVYGVLTTDSIEQAVERAGGKLSNKGEEYALTAVELANLYKQIPFI